MKLIIDTDPGDDDIIAILLALSWPDNQVLAYIASFGNVDVNHCYNNILKTYGVLDRHVKACSEAGERFAGLKHVSTLIRGAEGPIEGPHPGDGAHFHGPDGLGNITTRYPNEFPIPEEASISHLLKLADKTVPYHEHILDILSKAEDKSVTWLVVGPLSSLAVALRHDPDLVKRKVERVVIMGGTFTEPGNANAVAEWNIYADAYAAHEVFNHSQGLRLYLCPLDITSKHQLTWPDYMRRIDPDFLSTTNSPKADPLTRFTSAFFRWTKPQTEKWCGGTFQLHDPLAAWFALCNPVEGKLARGWKVEATDVQIERIGEYTRGMCVVDKRIPPVHVSSPTLVAFSETAESKSKEKVYTINQEAPEQQQQKREKNRIYVVRRTPGPDALVEALFQRIWGSVKKAKWYKRVREAFKRLIQV